MKITVRNPFKREETYMQKVGRIAKDRAVHATVELMFGAAGLLVTAVGTKMLANSNQSNQKGNQNV